MLKLILNFIRQAALIEQVRVAEQSGFNAFSIGEHYNILGLQLSQPRSCAGWGFVPRRGIVRWVRRSCFFSLRHPVTVATELASLDIINDGKSFAAFGLGYRDEELNAFHLSKSQWR